MIRKAGATPAFFLDLIRPAQPTSLAFCAWQ
jgi:hypothetical protein